MSLRVGDLLWMGDVLPSTREICSIRQGSCFNKYPTKVSHPPPTRTMTCLLCSIWNERREKGLHSEDSYSISNQPSFLAPGLFLVCLVFHASLFSYVAHGVWVSIQFLKEALSFPCKWITGPHPQDPASPCHGNPDLCVIPCWAECVQRLLSDISCSVTASALPPFSAHCQIRAPFFPPSYFPLNQDPKDHGNVCYWI